MAVCPKVGSQVRNLSRGEPGRLGAEAGLAMLSFRTATQAGGWTAGGCVVLASHLVGCLGGFQAIMDALSSKPLDNEITTVGTWRLCVHR